MRSFARAAARLALSCSVSAFAACGGDSPSSPGGETHAVTVAVFYDEDNDGVLDAGEDVRLPGVTVTLAGRSATTGTRGRTTLDLPAGSHAVTIDPRTLPPWFVAAAAATVVVPAAPGTEAPIPVALPIGGNQPNVFMGFGDSLVSADSAPGGGFLDPLGALVRGHWGEAVVRDEGLAGTFAWQGAARIGQSLARQRPAWTVVLYGTNDWQDCREAAACSTPDDLRRMVQAIRATGSLPVVGTIPPVNPAFVERQATERNLWVREMNDRLVPVLRAEGAVLADVHAAMLAAAGHDPARLAALFADRIHRTRRATR